MLRSTVRYYGRSPKVDHETGTGPPLLGCSRSSIAQLNRLHPYSSRWVAVAFYLKQDAPPRLGARPAFKRASVGKSLEHYWRAQRQPLLISAIFSSPATLLSKFLEPDR